MLSEKRNRILRTWLILGGLVGLWLALVWGLPTETLQASSLKPALLTFESPIGNPALTISKEANLTSPRPGQTVIYTLRYANTNAGSQAFNVRLYDFLPAGIQLISTNPSYASYADGVLTFNAPSIGPGTTPVEVVVYGIVQEGFDELYNHAIVTADGVTPTHASVHTIVAPPVRELVLTKTGYPVVLKEGELVYQLQCENTGEVPVRNITVLDLLPGDVIYQSATPAPAEVTLPLLRWTVGTLEVGETWMATLVVTSPTTIGVITNTAMATADELPITSELFATQVVSEGAILYLTKTGAPAQTYINEPMVYTLTYQNIGNHVATSVRLTDTLPADVTVVGTVPTPPTLLSNTRVVWEIPTIAPNETGMAVITVTAQGMPIRILHNAAEIAAPGPDVYGSTAEFENMVIFRTIYLPLMLRAYHD